VSLHHSSELKRRLGLAPDRPYFEGFDPAEVPSPSFVIDRAALQYNLDILSDVAERSGAEILLALKAFSAFAVFDQVSEALSGCCASGPHEARLGREKIGKQVHSYSAAYSEEQLEELFVTSDHIVFNNLAQWLRFRARANEVRVEQRAVRAATGRAQLSYGIRINPEQREGTVDLYDPSAPGSRLGTTRQQFDQTLAAALGIEQSKLFTVLQQGWPEPLQGLEGLHFHNLCEQGVEPLERTLATVEEVWGDLLCRPEIGWLNMGGGHHITKPDYNRERLIELVRRCREQYQLKVILEPGEAIAIHTGILVSTVLDLSQNGSTLLATLDCSATCHMPDTLEMPYRAEIWGAEPPAVLPHTYRLGSQSCLAGDVMGNYSFAKPLQIGDRVIFDDMSHYTMVKTNTFNGIPLPSIVLWDSRTKKLEVVRSFGYRDFLERLS